MRRPAVDPRPSGLGYSCFVPPLLAMAKAKNSTSHLPRSDLALLLRPGKSLQQNKKSENINQERRKGIQKDRKAQPIHPLLRVFLRAFAAHFLCSA
jgi:hypothetical protein